MGPAGRDPEVVCPLLQLAFLLSKKCTSRISRRSRFRNDRACNSPRFSLRFPFFLGAPSSENHVSVLAFSVNKFQKRVVPAASVEGVLLNACRFSKNVVRSLLRGHKKSRNRKYDELLNQEVN